MFHQFFLFFQYFSTPQARVPTEKYTSDNFCFIFILKHSLLYPLCYLNTRANLQFISYCSYLSLQQLTPVEDSIGQKVSDEKQNEENRKKENTISCIISEYE